MTTSFFPLKGEWLKGNVHSHTTVSDGLSTPEQYIREYRAMGYDFLSVTDHNTADSFRLAGDSGVCLIPGWERDVRHNEQNTACIHAVGLFDKDPAVMEPIRLERPGVNSIPDQELLTGMQEDGQFVVLAHPLWSRMTPSDVLALDHFDAIEVFNTGAECLMHAGNAELYWDLLLEQGRRVLGIACDDTHGKTAKDDRFGGWIMVRCEERSSKAILAAMRAGDYYLSQGPVIEDWGLEDGTLYVKCSPCREIHVVTYPTRGKAFFPEEGATELRYPLKGGEKYVRVECIGEHGKRAWTNPFFF